MEGTLEISWFIHVFSEVGKWDLELIKDFPLICSFSVLRPNLGSSLSAQGPHPWPEVRYEPN